MSTQVVYPVAAIREIERRCLPDAQPPLMERAGRAAFEDATKLIADRTGPVLIACGPGNNGGDGFVLAFELHRGGREVAVAFAAHPDTLPEDAARAHANFTRAGGTTLRDIPAPPVGGWALVVDALFGIGLRRAIEGHYREWVDTLNAQTSPRLAIDLPSGLDADNGRCLGVCFRATHTSTFIALKPGLLTLDGPDHCGEITVHPIGIDPTAHLPAPGHTLSPALFADHLLPRPCNSHKGSYGDAGVLGGDAGMTGAALLAARAASWLGAGRVYAGLLAPAAPAVDPLYPELMLRAADRLPAELSALAVGPGLGTSKKAAHLLETALQHPIPLVLDADALNLIARHPRLASLTKRRSRANADTILTPHPAEAARLLAISTADVQADRLQAVLELARRYHACAVLKGNGSLLATRDGRWYINTTGHPGMASAGMGDALTGIVLGLLAQGWPTESALMASVHLHGAAADHLAAAGIGPVGLTASEVIAAARRVFNDWLKRTH
ncbi:MAG: NAD(P)H-hydrate dehydratase [Azoarcus sp.]|jgi:hydroxyethylthiazole kinase-like uncharacterized protein yjeF|nr:NAD(P)H-hydrate dehydratase [Azoarcus sp.]